MADMDVTGRTVVVTGAAVGIGEAVARDLARAGAAVVLVDVDSSVKELAASLGEAATAIVGDVADPSCPAAVVEQALSATGRLDGLVNNAGLVVNGTALTITDEEWERAIAVNATGPLRFIRAALPPMLERGNGSIVNLGSVVGVRARQDGVGYVTGKAAVIALTRSVALDFGRRGVRCNSISPGTVETPMLRGFEARNPGAMAQLAEVNYVGRLGQPGDVASLCRFLLSDDARFINGADILVDGGDTAAFGPPRPASWDPTARTMS